MGRDKASIPIRDGGTGLTLATRTAALLVEVCDPTLEVGPGHTGLRAVQESPAGQGPLVALVAGWRELTEDGWEGPMLVVSTDLPKLTVGMLEWLAGHGGSRSVVPVVHGRVQPLCARYSPADLQTAERLVAGGARAMSALLEATDPDLEPERSWATSAGGASVLEDVDTPADLRRVTGR